MKPVRPGPCRKRDMPAYQFIFHRIEMTRSLVTMVLG